CHERKSLLENRRQDERASAGDRLGASALTWSFMTKRTVNIRMVFAPSDGASASCPGDSARCEASLSTGFIACDAARVFDGEFDPGSGRTLAACLTHASRTRSYQWQHWERPSGERVSNT